MFTWLQLVAGLWTRRRGGGREPETELQQTEGMGGEANCDGEGGHDTGDGQIVGESDGERVVVVKGRNRGCAASCGLKGTSTIRARAQPYDGLRTVQVNVVGAGTKNTTLDELEKGATDPWASAAARQQHFALLRVLNFSWTIEDK